MRVAIPTAKYEDIWYKGGASVLSRGEFYGTDNLSGRCLNLVSNSINLLYNAGEAIERLRLDLLKRHPQLLSGLIESDDKSGKEIVL